MLLLATALRLYRLEDPDVWLDEANGVFIARAPLPELIDRLRLDSSPPLFYLLLRCWMAACGDSPMAIRSPSVISSVVLVAAVFLIGRRLFSLEVGLLASLLLSVAPIQVLYSQQARMYSLLPLLALFSTYLLWRATTDPRLRYVVGYGAATLAGLYVHNYALYLLPAHFLVLLWTGALRSRPGTWACCGACIALGYLPWAPVLLAQLHNRTHYAWFLPLWKQWGPAGVLLRTLDSFTAGRFSLSFIWTGQEGFMQGEPTEFAPLLRRLLFAGLAVAGLLKVVAVRSGRITWDGRVALLVAFVCVPLATALAMSCLANPSFTPGRADQMVFPAFVLLLALGLTRVRPLPLRLLVLAAVLAFSFAGLARQYGNRLPEPHVHDRAIAEGIAAHAQPGDAVVCTSLMRATLEYYLGRAKAPVRFLSYPPDADRHLGNQDDEVLLRDSAALARAAAKTRAMLQESGGPAARYFLVFIHHPVNAPLAGELLAPEYSRLLAELGRFRQAITAMPVTVSLRQLTTPDSPE